MSKTSRSGWITVGAVSAALAVIFGAFAAHSLEDTLLKIYEGKTHQFMGQTIPSAQKYLGDFETAAKYQMYCALGLIAVGTLSLTRRSSLLTVAGWSFLIGTILFSGSLYVLVMTGIKILGAVTPFGGVGMIIGWICLACAGVCRGREDGHGDQTVA